MKRAILLAGGSGSRLGQLTRVVNKHLLPVYDQPMIHYPLQTLRAMGVEEVLVITRPQDANDFLTLLGDGYEHGLRLHYRIQERPGGIAQGLLIGREFARREPVVLALGDQLLLDADEQLQAAQGEGASVFVHDVADVSEYASLDLDAGFKPTAIEEKPAPRAGKAVIGLYVFDGQAADVAKRLKPSRRGELEIVDVIRWYLDRGQLTVHALPAMAYWADLGTFDRLLAAGCLLRDRQHPRAI